MWPANSDLADRPTRQLGIVSVNNFPPFPAQQHVLVDNQVDVSDRAARQLGLVYQGTSPWLTSRSWNLGAADIPDLSDRAARQLGLVYQGTSPWLTSRSWNLGAADIPDLSDRAGRLLGIAGRNWNLGAADVPDLRDRAARELGALSRPSEATGAAPEHFFWAFPTGASGVVHAPAAGKTLYVTSLSGTLINTDFTAAHGILLKDGAAGTTLREYVAKRAPSVNVAGVGLVQAGDGDAVITESFPEPLPFSTGFYINNPAATLSAYGGFSGYEE